MSFGNFQIRRIAVPALALTCVLSGAAQAESYQCRLHPYQTFDSWMVADGKITVTNRSDLAPSPPWIFPIVKNNADELIGLQDPNNARFTLMLLIDKHTSKVAMLNLSPNSTYMDRIEGDCKKS